MAAFISVNKSSSKGPGAVNRLKALVDNYNGHVNEVLGMDYMIDGSDYTELELQYGLEAGDGEAFKNEMAALKGALDAASAAILQAARKIG